jgi:hypothetical protein
MQYRIGLSPDTAAHKIQRSGYLLTLLIALTLWPVRAAAPCGSGFAAAGSYTTGNDPRGTAAGDFNRDGFPDMAVANWTSNQVAILLGNAGGTLQPFSNFAASLPSEVTAADLNRDGRLDLIVAGGYEGRLFLGNGDGTFSPGQLFATGQGPRSPVVADFNRDSKPDVAFAVYTAGNISLFLGNGDGAFQAPVVYPNPYTAKILPGDFNRDGNPDLVSTRSYDNGTVTVWLGNGAGALNAATSYPETSLYLGLRPPE